MIIAYVWRDAGSKNYVSTYDNNGTFIRTFEFSDSAYATDGNGVTVDKDDNIYINGRWSDKILKLSSVGAVLAEVVADTPIAIAIAPDGFIWNYEYSGGNGIFVKRNATTLAQVDSFSPTAGGDYVGMAFDSDGNLYTVDWMNEVIEKWNVSTKTRTAYRTVDYFSSPIFSCLAVLGDNVYLLNWAQSGGDHYYHCPDDLSINFEEDTLTEFGVAQVISASQGNRLVIWGYISNVGHVLKYREGDLPADDLVLIWNTTADVYQPMTVGAYPFLTTPTVTTQAVTDY